MDVEFAAGLWLWDGPAAWHFVTVPAAECAELAAVAPPKGWGSVRVTARIGGTTWQTSLFPHDGQYLLPVKAAVRTAEGIEAGDQVTVRLTLG